MGVTGSKTSETIALALQHHLGDAVQRGTQVTTMGVPVSDSHGSRKIQRGLKVTEVYNGYASTRT